VARDTETWAPCAAPTGGTQLGLEETRSSVFWFESLLGLRGDSRLPGACKAVTLGDSARRSLDDRIPRADARLLAIEELSSR
jgi:hypothetical protein